jgi:hypothetical protein
MTDQDLEDLKAELEGPETLARLARRERIAPEEYKARALRAIRQLQPLTPEQRLAVKKAVQDQIIVHSRDPGHA